MRTELLTKSKRYDPQMSFEMAADIYSKITRTYEHRGIMTPDETYKLFLTMRHVNRWTLSETLGWLHDNLFHQRDER